MCKYCEKVADRTGSVDYYERNQNSNIYRRKSLSKDSFWLESPGMILSIYYCPWCGRKLEAPKKDPEDEVAELAKQLQKLRQQVDDMAKTQQVLWSDFVERDVKKRAFY